MDNKKIVYISVAVAGFLFTIMCTMVIFMSKGSSSSVSKSMKSTIETYLENVNTGKFKEAYQSMSSYNENLSEEKYVELMTLLMDEDNARIEVNDKKKTSKDKIVVNKKQTVKIIKVPVTRVYKCTIDGLKQQVKEEMELSVVEEKNGSKIYYHPNVLDGYIENQILEKANRAAIDALQNKSDEKLVLENVAIIERCVKYANRVSSSYKGYKKVLIQSNLMLAYKEFILGKDDKSLNYIKQAYTSAESVEDKIRVKRVEAELYKSMGDYDAAVKVLSEALEISPTNVDVRREYRDVNGRMLDNIQSYLESGWAQLKSAIEQKEKERNRILSDVSMEYAENAIALKKDAPDGYYLKGNIYYCLGKYSEAIRELETALEFTNSEDIMFRNKVSEILGMAKMSNSASPKVEFDAKSYKTVYDGEIRSYIFRDNEVGGLIDATK